MIYTKKVNEAIKLMYENHKNQIDKAGIPYVFHPWHVAETMTDETSTIVALLHDIVEDTDITIGDLKEMGFSEDVIEALKVLTHKKEEDYFDYINRVSSNSIAIDVKIADLKHNMDFNRLETISDKYKEKYQKYQKSLDFLISKKNEK